MSNTRRRGGLRAPRHVGDETQMDPLWKTGPAKIQQINIAAWVWQLLLAPWDAGEGPDVWDTIVYFIMEVIGSFLVGLLVNATIFAASGPSAILDGLVIGAVHAAVFYFSWQWTREYALRRHLNWVITVSYIFTGDVGIVTFLGYGAAQIGGAAAAGGVLSALGMGTVPDYTSAATGTTLMATYGMMFLVTFLIGFFILYNEKYEQKKEEELRNHNRTGVIVAFLILGFTAAFFQIQLQTLGSNVVYFAGLVGAGASANSDLVATGFVDWAFYLFFPLVGAAGAGIVFLLFYMLLMWIPDRNQPADESTKNDKETGMVDQANMIQSRHRLLTPFK